VRVAQPGQQFLYKPEVIAGRLPRPGILVKVNKGVDIV